METKIILGTILGLSKSRTHTFSKSNTNELVLIKGIGIEGDAHAGEKVKHRSRVRKDPNQINLRQVHLIHSELFDELNSKGFVVKAGDLGENICTQNIDLLGLKEDAVLKIGSSAVIRITGLRNPCSQLDRFQDGLMQAVLARGENNKLIRKAGIMAVVEESGTVKLGDPIVLMAVPEAARPLDVV